MNFIKKYPLLLLFAGFLFYFFVANILAPDKTDSELENRKLTQSPPFTWTALIDINEEQKFSTRYEKYLSDQFVGRDGWITLKSVGESLIGKIENNGIIYGKNNFMFENYPTMDEERVKMNLKFFNTFVETYQAQTNITLGLIPSSYQILPELTPVGMPNVDQRASTKELYDQLAPETIRWDLDKLFSSLPDRESLYYKTDHHWTTEGAFAAYRDFAALRGLKAPETMAGLAQSHQAPDFLGSHYSTCKRFSAVPDVITWYDIPFTSFTIKGVEKDALYDSAKWEVRDKYGAFLWSNNDLSIIRSENNLNRQEGKTSRILLVKDSYGNCFAPFLTYSYDEVWIVDPRFFTEDTSKLMARTTFDDVLVMYRFISFAQDTFLVKLTY